MERSATFSPEELPDGSFIVPHRGPTAAQLGVTAGDQAVVRPAEYIGSFTVKGNDYKERTEFVHRKLESMRIVTRSKPILMVISLSGVKVCSESGDSVFMAHALKRISYATCTPEYCQFSFLAREPNSQLRPSTANSGDSSACPSVQHCHSFITQTPEQAEELNNIIGDAFKMAYALRRRQKTPTFNEVIERQLQQQQQQQQHHQQQQLQGGAQLQQYQLQLRDFGVVPSKEDLSACDCSQTQPQPQQEAMKAYPRHNTTSSNLSNDKNESEKPLPPPPYGANKTANAANKQSNDQSQSSAAAQTPQPQRQQRQQSQEAQQQNQQSSWSRQQSQQQSQQSQQPQAAQQQQQQQPQQSQQQQAAGGSKSYGSPVVAFKERMESSPAAQAAEYQLQQFSQQPYPRQHSLSQSEGGDESRRHRPLPPPPGQGASSEAEAEDGSGGRGRSGAPAAVPEDAPLLASLSTSAPQSQSQAQHTPPPPIPTRFNSLHKYDQQPTTSTIGSANSGGSSGGGGGGCSTRSVVSNSAAPSEEEWLSRVPWYMPSIPREIALELLAQEDDGSFVVRDSASHPGCYALSVKVPVFDNPSRISHYLIQRTQRGVKLKGLEKEWPNLQSLVVHLTVMQEMLPCTLRLPRAAQNPAFRPGVEGMEEEEEEEEEEDLDYQRLSDFTSMMAELRQLQQA